MTASPQVSIVVLSYDRPAYLRQALASLTAQQVTDREIMLVDNRSPSSPEIARIAAQFPEVRLLALPDNLGFTGGMNAGIALATGRHVLLTEDDLVLDPGCTEAMLRASASLGPRTAVTGVLLKHGSALVHCAGGEVRLGPPFRLEIIGAGEDVRAVAKGPYEVSYAPGSFLLFPRDALRELGGFRPDYFMYLDDVELCVRARRHGLALVVVPQARAAHLPPATGRAPAQLEFHKVKNLLATYLLHAPTRVLPEVAARYVLLEAPRRLFGGPQRFLPFLRACAWTALHAPTLLRDRRRGRAAARAAIASARTVP